MKTVWLCCVFVISVVVGLLVEVGAHDIARAATQDDNGKLYHMTGSVGTDIYKYRDGANVCYIVETFQGTGISCTTK